MSYLTLFFSSALVAQWQSTSFVNWGSWVQIPPRAFRARVVSLTEAFIGNGITNAI